MFYTYSTSKFTKVIFQVLNSPMSLVISILNNVGLELLEIVSLMSSAVLTTVMLIARFVGDTIYQVSFIDNCGKVLNGGITMYYRFSRNVENN